MLVRTYMKATRFFSHGWYKVVVPQLNPIEQVGDANK